MHNRNDKLKTSRIQLVLPSLNLVAESQEAVYESRHELQKYLGWVQSSQDNPEANMQTAIDNHNTFSNELRYYIINNSTNLLIGAVGLIVRDIEVPFFEIGYWIRTTETGKGYATEAVNLIESYAFDELGAVRLEIRVASCNENSRAVAQRCDYNFEAELKNDRRLPTGKLSNTFVYSKCKT